MKPSPSSRIYDQSGVTLSEILVVICIGILLMAILSPALSKALEGARSAQCVGNLKQLAAAATAYAADNNMQLPPASTEPLGRLPHWFEPGGPLIPYLNGPQDQVIGMDFLKCPSAKMTADSKFVSYGVNYRYVFFVEALDPTNADRMRVYPGSARLNRIPSSSFLFGDCGTAGFGRQGYIYSPYWWTFEADTDGDGRLDTNKAVGGGPFNWFAPRHNGAGNMARADGSVIAITPEQWAKNEGGIWGPDFSDPESSN